MMKVHCIKILVVLSVLFNFTFELVAQGLTDADYKKALWMTTRFYGGQRSGENNWTVYNHQPNGVSANLAGKSFMQDADGTHDLSGGWFDCGDHVKFGQTQYYSGYMLLKGYAEFKAGYDDRYSSDYKGYGTANNFTFEGGAGTPNGIPDVLDEVKHATDYFIKCARNASTFYYEVGNGNYDHAEWITSVKMQTNAVNKGGDPRPIAKNPNDGAMPSMCAATLALMSRMYRPFDAAYADLCLQHAKYAHQYASNHVGQSVGAASGSFYSRNDNPYNAWAICLSEMFFATKESTYKSTALSLTLSAASSGQVHPNEGYTFDYSNNGELALYDLAQLGHPNAKAALNTRMQNHWLVANKYNGEGAYTAGGGWGKLRYVGNAGFVLALYNKLNGHANLDSKVYGTVDYLLGKNNSKFSFVVGFVPSTGGSYPKHPHHRNVYLNDNNPGNNVVIEMASKNIQLGALVGGSLTSGGYNDDRSDYVNSEVCIDYNAGITGALGAINAYRSPIDTNQFFTQCAKPNLGDEKSLCGSESITLNAELGIKSGRTFQWFKDDVSQGAPSSSATTKTITQAGTWKVVVDSAVACQRSATVVITGTLPTVDLGDDVELCSPAQVTLDANISGGGISYAWKKGTQSFGGNTKTVEVTEEGVYEVTLSASGCSSQKGSVVVTSSLPVVEAQVLCSAGTTSLDVTSSGGPFEWYTAPTGGSPVFTGGSFTPNITATKTYYVKNAGSFEQTIGPKQGNNSLTTTSNGGAIGILFTTETGFDIVEMKIQPYVFNCNPGDMVQLTMELQNASGTKISTHVATPIACTGSQQGPFTKYYTMDFSNNPIRIPSAGNYILKPSAGNQLAWYENGANYNSYQIEGVMNITGDTRNDKPNSFPGVFDIKVSSGNDCDRMPVVAKIDGNDPNCVGTCSKPSNATITPAGTQNLCGSEKITLTANNVSGYLYRWYKNGTPVAVASLNNNTLEVSQTGEYSVRIGDGDTDDNTCYLESSKTIVNVNDYPEVVIASTTLEYCSNTSNGVTLTVENQNGAIYEWSGPVTGNTVSLQNATAGDYVVKVTKNNCSTISEPVGVVDDCVTSTSHDLFESQFNLYPNPSVSSFILEQKNTKNNVIRIVDLNGVLVLEREINQEGNIEFGNDLTQGVYLLQIIQGDKVFTKQITKFD